MKFICTCYSPYAGTNSVYFLIADSYEDAQEYMDEILPDYIEQWEYLARAGYDDEDEDGEDFYDSQEYAFYVEDCGVTIKEATDEDCEDYGGHIDWEDIRINP